MVGLALPRESFSVGLVLTNVTPGTCLKATSSSLASETSGSSHSNEVDMPHCDGKWNCAATVATDSRETVEVLRLVGEVMFLVYRKLSNTVLIVF